MYLFLDTEFTDFVEMELLSIGIVSEDGQHEFYAEVSGYTRAACSQFVLGVVLPLMDPEKYARPYTQVAADLAQWVDSLPQGELIFIVDYTGDFQLLNELFQVSKPARNSKTWFYGAAFQEMLEMRLIHSPAARFAATKGMIAFASQYYNIDGRQHHALVDAKANRYGWVKGYEYAVNQLSK